MADLDDFLLGEIFVRLSVKFLHRFKCVSKHWLSLISDTRFVHEYVQFQTSHTNYDHDDDVYKNLHRTTFICRGIQGLNPYRLDFPSNAFDQYDGFSFKFIPKKIQRRRIKLLAASHGWILCSTEISYSVSGMSRCIYDYHLCSPLFKQWISIPRSPDPKDDKGYCPREFCSVGFMCEEDLTSNCSNNSNTRLAVKPLQFKVVQAWTNYHVSMVMVFSSETWEWRTEWLTSTIACESRRNLWTKVDWEYWNPCTVSCDGNLYWIGRERDVLALDLDADGNSLHWHSIPFPQRVSDRLECVKLGLCHGQIHLSCWDYDGDGLEIYTVIFIWKLIKEVNTDDHHDHYQWSLKHNVRIERSHFSFTDVSMVDFAPLDEDILYIMLKSNQTGVFNLKNNTMIEKTKFDCDHTTSDMIPIWIRVPFVLPYWPLPLKTPKS